MEPYIKKNNYHDIKKNNKLKYLEMRVKNNIASQKHRLTQKIKIESMTDKLNQINQITKRIMEIPPTSPLISAIKDISLINNICGSVISEFNERKKEKKGKEKKTKEKKTKEKKTKEKKGKEEEEEFPPPPPIIKIEDIEDELYPFNNLINYDAQTFQEI
jgi:hypothetical protein